MTPAWWDDLWLAEAFASWLSDKIAIELGAIEDVALAEALQREHALEADSEPDAKPLRRAVVRNDDPDNDFDTIAYDKGAAVLATLNVGSAGICSSARYATISTRIATVSRRPMTSSPRSLRCRTPPLRAPSSFTSVNPARLLSRSRSIASDRRA